MNWITLTALIWFAGYLAICVHYFGVTTSISETFYKWHTRDYSAAFVWFAFGICVLMFLQSAQPYKQWTQLTLALSGFFLACVSVAANYKLKKVGALHYGVTILSTAGGFTANVIEFGWWAAVPIGLFVVGTVWMKKAKIDNLTYWLECLAFGTVMMLFVI